MASTAPIIDPRTFDELVQQLRTEAQRRGLPWPQLAVGAGRIAAPDDARQALTAVFAHYLEILLQRLNQTPTKNLLAFLDLLGVGRLPPGAARAPLVFTLSPKAGATGFVPKGAQVATVQSEKQAAVIYETEQDLNVVAAQVVASYTVDPFQDRYACWTATVRGEEAVTFTPFAGNRLLDHLLLLGAPVERPLFVRQPGRLLVELTARQPAPATAFVKTLPDLRWELWQNQQWQPLPEPQLLSGEQSYYLSFSPATLLDVGDLRETAPGVATPGRWLRAVTRRPLTKTQDPLTTGFTPQAVALRAQSAIRPEQGLAAGTLVDFTADFQPFGPNGVVGAEFWLASAVGFAEANAHLYLLFDLVNPAVAPAALQLVWEYWNGTAWQAIRLEENADSTARLQRSGRISFVRPADLGFGKPADAGAVTDSYWLRVRVTGANYQRAPLVRAVHILRGLPPDAGASGAALLDISKPFPPLGPQPKRNDAFYIASQEVFAQRGATVHLFLNFSTPGIPTPGVSRDDGGKAEASPFRLLWEYGTQHGWRRLGHMERSFTADFKPDRLTTEQLSDSTQGWQRDGEVAFTIPDDIAEVEVAGRRSYWVRVRLASGDFGRPAEFVLVNPTAPTQGFRPKQETGNLNVPVLQTLTLAYDYEQATIQPLVVTRNGFMDQDLTVANQTVALPAPLLVSAPEARPTFYLGFDRKLPNSAVSLYFVAPPRQFVEKLPVANPPAVKDAPAPVFWQYYNGRQWVALTLVLDRTANLTQSGGVQLIGPPDLAATPLFALPPYYWLRIQAGQDTAPSPLADESAPPGTETTTWISGLFLNAVEALQATTVQNEVLGSSNGRKHQVMQLAKAPVLAGQRIWVQEPERPAAAEEAAIQQEEGADAVQDRPGSGEPRGLWVRWHEVKSLHQSSARSRHYALDRITGQIFFGDGVHGLIPPVGRDNIVCERYRAGGGAAGNQPAGAITQLKTSIPYIAAVTNPMAADGGANAETLAAAQARGPQTLRHRGHAVTASDFEWLARQAVGTRVARSTCLPNRNRALAAERGWLTLIIVPAGPDKKLLPSPQLLREVTTDLQTRSLATLTDVAPVRFNVTGPGYLPVEIEAEIVPVNPAQGDAVRNAVVTALDAFLHPLTGGPAGEGWELGRDVFLSELYAAFEALPGVEHVESLRFKPTVATLPLTFDAPPPAAVCYPPGSTLSTADKLVTAVVVEAIAQGAPLAAAMVTLFHEGERIRLGAGLNVVETTIRTITGNTLRVEPFRAQTDYVVGTVITTTASPARSVLVNQIAQGALVDLLVVRGFEVQDGQDGVPSVLITNPPQTNTQELHLKLDEQQRLVLGERLRVPEFYLVYAGQHTVTLRSPVVEAERRG